MLSQAPSMRKYCSRRIQQATDRGWQVYPHECGVAQVCGMCVLRLVTGPQTGCFQPLCSSHRQSLALCLLALWQAATLRRGSL